MAQSYLIVKTNQSIRDFNINEVHQMQLIENETGLTEGDARTKMIRTDSIHLDHEEILSFDVNHDFKVKQQGRVFEQPFSYYFSPRKFKIYFIEDKNLMFVNVKKEVAYDFVSLLKEYFPTFEYDLVEIDLNKITSKISQISTAWVDVSKQDVAVQSFHGPSIGTNDEVLDILKLGRGKYINFYYIYNEVSYYVGISKESSLTAYTNSLSEVNRLIFLKIIYKDLIEEFVV